MTANSQTARGLIAGVLLACLSMVLPLAGQERLAIKAGHVVTGTGPVLKNATILVVDGRIQAIETGLEAAPKGFRLVDHSGSYVAAGMIDLASEVSAGSELSEPSQAIEWESSTADVLVSDHADWKYLRSCGVTSVVVLPSAENVVSGYAGVTKAVDDLDFVARRGPIIAALTSTVTSSRRLPTSAAGAVQMLREELAKKDNAALRELREGKRGLICRVSSTYEIRAAIGIMDQLGFAFTLMTRGTLRDVMPGLKDQKLSVALPALTFDSPQRDYLLPAELLAGGHRLAFFAGTPDRSAEALRLSAALAVRYGLEPESAWATVTAEPARMAGLADRIGTLAKGRDADLVVYSGHPIDLSSVLQKTYINGRLVYSRPETQEKAKE